jgi:hypothetical protein
MKMTMMMMSITAALVLISGAASAQTAPAVPSDGAAAVKVKPPKPMCRSEDVTGSFFQQRTCHSKEEWAAIDAVNAANAERMSASRSGNGGVGR